MIVAAVVDCTGSAPNETKPLVLPADTVTSAGSVIAGLLLARLTRTCPGGAAAVRLTKPTPPCPPDSVLTLTVSDDSAADVPLTVNGARSTTSS